MVTLVSILPVVCSEMSYPGFYIEPVPLLWPPYWDRYFLTCATDPTVHRSELTRHDTFVLLRDHATTIVQMIRQSFPFLVLTNWGTEDRDVSANWLSRGRRNIVARRSNNSGLGACFLSPTSGKSLNTHINFVLPYLPLRVEGYLGESDMWISGHQAVPWWASFSSHTEAKIHCGVVVDYCDACGVALAWHGLEEAPLSTNLLQWNW